MNGQFGDLGHCVKVASRILCNLAEQLPGEPGPLLPAMAVREWLLQHADVLLSGLPGEPSAPTAAIDPAQLDALRNSLVLGFCDSEVVRADVLDDYGDVVWHTATMDEAQRMAEVAMVAITATVVQ